MDNIQKISVKQMPPGQGRVETGTVQFNDDWPGVFIRGDNAFYYAMMLNAYLEDPNTPFAKEVLEGLAQVLKDCSIKPNK